jgi:hypothetical protein
VSVDRRATNQALAVAVLGLFELAKLRSSSQP